ncbi:MAG: hypothetical protein EXR37_08010 [Limnohabitans sp.]|nr:hypothetical protein [Limnohabitans sp.]
MGFIIVLATPVFLLAIAFECWWGWHLSRQGQAVAQTYRWDDAINSISLGMVSGSVAIRNSEESYLLPVAYLPYAKHHL